MAHARGHRLRSGNFPSPSRIARSGVIIVGGGIAGLSAAWALDRAGFTDFALLDLEDSLGGNARAGQSAVCAYPLGAHYLPLPPREATLVRSLLAELDVLQGAPDAERPSYDERYLCATPQERIYRDGLWDEGVLPQRGLSADERAQQQRFGAAMTELKQAFGSDGRKVFAIPMALSSRDEAWRRLDRQTFRDWLLAQGYTAPTLHWLANYACRDDYGTDYAQTSAWAGLHYFACRTGEAANAQGDCVLTAPEGNAWLANGLARRARGRTHTNTLAIRIESGKDGIAVDALRDGEVIRFVGRHVIWAAPLFVLPHVWPAMPGRLRQAAQRISYAPWLVANLHLDAPPQERHGAPPAWDNILFDGPGLGYVSATHQLIRRHQGATVWTYYRALSDMTPAAARQLLLDTPRETWAGAILSELEVAHPDLRQRTTRLDIFRHGHAMCRPTPGSLFYGEREFLAEMKIPQLTLAHADLSGFSLFEEAQFRGVQAAWACMQQLGLRRRAADQMM